MEHNTIKHITDILESWQFPVLESDESYLLFRYQLHYIQVSVSSGDDPFIALNLRNFFPIETDSEKLVLDKVCNYLNYKLMQLKVYHDPDLNVTISFEFFYTDTAGIEPLMRRGLSSLITAKREFARLMLEFAPPGEEDDADDDGKEEE